MGIDLPRDIGTRRLPWQRLLRIIEHLPAESATSRARRAEQPDLDTQFLRSMEYWIRILAWQQTKDGSKGQSMPERVSLPGDTDKQRDDADSLRRERLLVERSARAQRRQNEARRNEGRA
jgi:hypothetical protein